MDFETTQRLQREYMENRIRAAHPLELVTMLYQVAMDSLNEAIHHLRTNDRLARSRAITRAEQAVEELLVSLDHSANAAFTRTLASLYKYCLERMIAGHAQQSETAFHEALAVLSTLSVAWREIKDQTCGAAKANGDAAEPSVDAAVAEEAMEEAQQVSSVRYGGYQEGGAPAGSRDWSC